MNEAPVAIVTAAGRGIGAGIARDLAGAGYRLALLSPSGSAESLAAELGGVAVRGLVAEPADLEALVALTVRSYGRIDALVNNTGVIPKGDLLEHGDEVWHESLDLILLNVVRMLRMTTPIMQAQGKGAIVNISTYCVNEPSLDLPVSVTLRAALSNFSKLYAERYAADGIRINNVLPGYVDTVPRDRSITERIPMGRAGHVGEIAGTVRFLLSDAAGYITGQDVRVDGGLGRRV